MTRLTTLAILASLSGFVAASHDDEPRSGSWSGVLVNSECTPDEAFAEADKCTEPAAGAILSLYDDTTREVFKLEPQSPGAGRLGASVIVRGVLRGDTIRVSSVEPLSSIGLAVGRKAPPISARDQSGRERSLDTLKGPRGTVLLFFRSADW